MTNIKFKIAYIKYLEYIESRQKIQSITSLKYKFQDIILPFFENYNIYAISEKDYIDFKNMIEKKHYSNNYKKNIHYLITAFFDYMIIYYKVKKNIPRICGNFKMNNEDNTYSIYTLHDYKLFINNVSDNVYKQFFNILFWCGLRPGEAMALKFSDLNDKKLNINKTIDEHGKRAVTSPKTFKSRRIIAIDNKLNKDLINLEKYYIKKYNKKIDFYIFGGIKPLSPTTINRRKKDACIKANVKSIKLHEFRHSNATLLVTKKLMINEISRRLGHSNVSTTLNIYTHTNNEQEKKVLRTLNFLRLFYE